MLDQHLTTDDMPLFTRLRMTAFGEAVIDIANDPTYDQWTFSQKIRHALEQETAARTERRVLKLLKASRTPNPAACVEDIRYLDGRNLNRELVARLRAQLSPEERELVELVYTERLTFAEVGDRLGLTETAARVRHYRILKHLKTLAGVGEARP